MMAFGDVKTTTSVKATSMTRCVRDNVFGDVKVRRVDTISLRIQDFACLRRVVVPPRLDSLCSRRPPPAECRRVFFFRPSSDTNSVKS